MMRLRLHALALAALFCSSATPLAAKSETWVEARSPNFIVVTNAGEKQARKTAIQFEQIRAVFRETLPFASANPNPIVTIIAVKNEDSLRALLPEYWATKGHTHPGGLFADVMDQPYIAVQLDIPGDNPYAAIYHEYYHSLTVPYYPLPVWLAEGLAEFYGHTQVSGNEVFEGAPSREELLELSSQQWIPLGALFKVDHNSPYYNEQSKTSVFYAESWVLTHYLLAGDRGAHRSLLQGYLSAIGKGETADQAIQAFGDLDRLEATLQTYVRSFQLYSMKFPAPAAPPASQITVKSLSPVEAAAYRGGLSAVRGRFQDAEKILGDTIQADPKCALAYRNLAFAEFLQHKQADALQAASEAISLDPNDGLSRYIRADLSFRAPGDAARAQAEDDLRHVVASAPDFAPAYSLLGFVLASRGNQTEAFAMAKKAVLLEPGRPDYLMNLAQVLAEMRRFDDAQLIALRARAASKTEAERGRVDQFLAEIQRMRSFAAESQQASGNAPASVSAPTQPQSPGAALPSGPVSAHIDLSGLSQAIGIVQESSCAKGFRLVLSTDSGLLHLYTAPGAETTLITSGTPPPGFSICDMKGTRVKVWYSPLAGDPSSGIPHQVEVLGNQR